MVLSDRMSVKRARVDGATASVSGQEFGEGRVKVIGNEGGNDVLIAIRDDKKVTCTNGVEVVLPSRARKYTWLRAGGTGSMSLCISVHCFGREYISFSLLV